MQTLNGGVGRGWNDEQGEGLRGWNDELGFKHATPESAV